MGLVVRCRFRLITTLLFQVGLFFHANNYVRTPRSYVNTKNWHLLSESIGYNGILSSSSSSNQDSNSETKDEALLPTSKEVMAANEWAFFVCLMKAAHATCTLWARSLRARAFAASADDRVLFLFFDPLYASKRIRKKNNRIIIIIKEFY